MSPDGRYVAALRLLDKGAALVTADLDAEELNMSAQLLGSANVEWLKWASEERLVVASSTSVPVFSSRQGLIEGHLGGLQIASAIPRFGLIRIDAALQ